MSINYNYEFTDLKIVYFIQKCKLQIFFSLGFVKFEQPCQLRDDVEASQKRCNDLLNESKKSVLFI